MKDHFATAALQRLFGALVFWALVLTGPLMAADLRLIMFEEEGCIWCARWEAEIGPAWPNTEQSEIAPLSKVDIHDDLPEAVTLDRPAAFTPTFVLLSEGTEVGRIEGYPGADFFWFLLDELIAQAPDDPTDS